MLELSFLSAKQLRIHIKNGATPEDLMNEYNCTEEQLKERIQRLYSQGNGKKAQDLYNELKGNRKKHQRKSKTESDASSEETTLHVEVIPVTLDELKSDLGIAPDSDSEKTLVDLEQEEGILSSEVMKIESDHKDCAQKHHSLIGSLRKRHEELEEIKAKLQACRDDYEKIVAEANIVAEQMNKICKIRRDKMVALEAVRQAIEEKKTVTLYVFNDGRVEAPDNPEFVIDGEGYQDLKLGLSERDECQDLRVRDIDTLARLLKISEKVEKLTLVCEDEKLEAAFLAVKGA